SWMLAPFIFNPYQFAHSHFMSDVKEWQDFFFAQRGAYWRAWYLATRLKVGSGLRGSGIEVLKRAFFIGCWYTILNQKVHMLSVIFEGGVRSFMTTMISALPPIGLSILACLILPPVLRASGCLGHGEELQLGWAALVVVLLDTAECLMYLWKLVALSWWKSFCVGLLLKFSLLSLCIELVECAFRLKGSGGPPDWLKSSIKMWLYGHRMAQDLLISSLIFAVLCPGVLFDRCRTFLCGCEGCGLHNILIYRDPGGVHKTQAVRIHMQEGEVVEGAGEL
ncbi:unnamed protein product, partial [Effrenium voratum]